MDQQAGGSGAAGDEAGGGAGGGDGAGTGAGGAPGQQGDAGQGQGGGAAGGVGFAREKLHPAIRGMNPEEINDLFETMAQGLRTVASGQGGAGGGQQGSANNAPPKEEEVVVDYKAMLDPSNAAYDPEKAFGTFVQKNYGRLIGDINNRSVRSTFTGFRQQFGDFQELEPEIEKLLQGRNPATLTEQDVAGAYFTAKGVKHALKERQEAAVRKGVTTQPPSPPAGGGGKPAELSDTEKQVARKMFRKSADPEGDYIKALAKEDQDGGMTVKVPLGGGRTG